MAEELDSEAVEDRATIEGSSEETLARVIKLFAGIAALILAASIVLIVWLASTFVQRFASFLLSLMGW